MATANLSIPVVAINMIPAVTDSMHFMKSDRNVIHPLEKLVPKIVIVWLSIIGFKTPMPIIRGNTIRNRFNIGFKGSSASKINTNGKTIKGKRLLISYRSKDITTAK